MFTDTAITHYLLTFGSACATLVLAFLLLGIRISRQEELRKLRTARGYLAGAYFVLAASGFFSWFMHVEAERDAVLMASTLFIASAQAFLFATMCITFIRPAYVGRRFIAGHLFVIAIVGVALVLTSILAEDTLFQPLFYVCIALYVVQLLRYVHLFRREYGRSLKQLEAYYDEDENYRLRWVKVCFYSALGIGVWALASLFAGGTLYCLFILAYTAYYTYMVYRFYNYVTDASLILPALSAKTFPAGAEEEAEPTEEERRHIAEKENQLRAALEQWRQAGEYRRGDVGVDDIAESLGTNRNFLRYYFRTHMSVDFRAWRNELRVREAQKLIEEHPDMSLIEVSRMVGFNYPSNLHRQFEKITGTTPAEFRKHLRA